MFDWFNLKTVQELKSPINGPIKVLRSRGEYSVWVDKFEQSGDFYIRQVWVDALEKVTRDVSRCLILGLGCGTAAKLVTDKWPKAEIVGVEIDPAMIKLGRKYFALGKIPNLKIVNKDARQFVNSTTQKFDLILSDLYIGNKNENFTVPKKLLLKGGMVITNSLRGLTNKLVVEY